MDTLSQQGIIFTHGHIQCCYFIAAASQDDKGVQRKTSGVRKKISLGVQGGVGTRAIGCTLCEFMSLKFAVCRFRLDV